MQILPCDAPTEPTEPAPLTDLPFHMAEDVVSVTAFWGGEEAYYVRAEDVSGAEQWYRVVAETVLEHVPSAQELEEIGRLMSKVLPLGPGRVAFPTGSSGRVVYRIWRTRGAAAARTRIRGVRAARSHRLPA
jgi:hypothetical protein